MTYSSQRSQNNKQAWVFCEMHNANCEKLSSGNLRKIRSSFSCGIKGKVLNKSMWNVA